MRKIAVNPLFTLWLCLLVGGVFVSQNAFSQPDLDARLFVEQQYRDFLGRDGEAQGIDYWTRELEQGRVSHAEVADLFYSSTEFQNTIAPVARLYFAYFGRIPDYPGLMHWVNTRLAGGDLNDMSQAFAESDEFQTTYGLLDEAAFVDLVYQNILGRQPDSAGRGYWINELLAGMTRGAMMVAFSESEEYWNRSFHQVQVTMMYVAMLRRSPEPTGFEYWVSAMGAGGSILDLIGGFLASQEYLQRFNVGAPMIFSITTSSGNGGSIRPSSLILVQGATAQFEVTPNAGYVIDTVSGCDGSLSGTRYTTGPINQACTVSAVFVASRDVELIEGRYLPLGDGSMIRDTVTGLEWMRCPAGKVWFDDQCVGDASSFTFLGAIRRAETLNASGHGGYADWRVPNIADLRSLVYCSNTGQIGIEDSSCGASPGSYDSPTIVQAAFPNTPASSFWSVSSSAGSSEDAWSVSFDHGRVNNWFKGSFSRVRLVRGGQFWPLAIQVTGTGFGRVSTSETPESCTEQTCTSSVREGRVTLQAQPDAGSRFTGWGGACSGSDPLCEISVTQATSVTAVFTLDLPTIQFVTFGGSAMDPVVGEYGAMTTLPEPRPLRNEDVFIEWNAIADGSGIGYRPGASVGPLEQDFMLYAQWGSLLAPSSVTPHSLDAGLLVAWSAVPGVDGYQVYVSTTPGIQTTVPGSYQQRITDLRSPFTWVNDLDNGTTYYVVVTAVYDDRHSSPSAEVSATPAVGANPALRPMPLNDTGIDWCADSSSNLLDCPVEAHPGQDGDHGRDAQARRGELNKIGGGAAGFDFTKLGADGQPLVIQDALWADGGNETDGSRWSCVRDNHTGLIWEVKLNDPNHLQHHGHTYTWYDPASPDDNPGTQNGGSCVGSACDTTGFMQAVNAQGLCGANDWRVPELWELESIVHLGRSGPAIDASYFPNTPSDWSSHFWSASPYAGYSDLAWDVGFSSGGGGWDFRSSSNRVRLVRGGQ